MTYTVLGVRQNDKSVVAGVVAGHHEVYGGDEEIVTGGLRFADVTADDNEHHATTEATENAL